MNLNDLRLFIRVVETGSFTAAGESLRIQKSTISRRIAQLEDAMGVRLLQRSTRKLQLTDEGRDMFERCRPLVDELEQARDQVSALHTEPRGLLRLTMPPELGAFIMNGVVASFMKRFPLVEVDIELSTRLVSLIEEGIDLAVRVGNLNDSTLISRRLAGVELGLYASPAYLAQAGQPATPADLAAHCCLGMRGNNFSWQFSNWQSGAPITIEGRLRSNSLTFLREMVLQDLGIARLPCQFCTELVEQGALVPVLVDYRIPPVDIHVLYPSRRHLNPRVRLFIDHMAERLQDHAWVNTD